MVIYGYGFGKIVVGNETTRSGVNRFWHLVQDEHLNRRFIWILIELFLVTLFPKNTISNVFDVHKT